MRMVRALTAAVVLGGMVALIVLPRQVKGAPDAATTKALEEAMRKGQPKTALEILEPILARALKYRNYPRAIKLTGQKIALEGIIQGNKPEEKIVRLQAEIAKAPKEMQPVMEAVLANWYWHFFQQNRWRFMQRTATAQPPGDDILSWDLPRILAEIDGHFTTALAAERQLKKIPVAEYDPLLEKGNVPDTYRPTLYDFVAFEALSFYAAGEQAGSRAEDAFDLQSDSPVFATTDEFVKWQVQTTDSESVTVKAVKLYQDLMQFHRRDRDQAAFLDADLGRLNFGYNKAVGEGKADRYKAALKRFVEDNGDHEISARARCQWAGVLQEEGELVEAHKLATQGERAFPNSFGGKMCHNLIEGIEAKSAQASTERVWNAPWPTIQVRYRNLEKVYFRVVRVDWAARMKAGKGNRAEWLNGDERKEILVRKPEREWSAKLPPTADYQERVEELPPPTDLKPGFYFLLASFDPAFGEADNQVHYTDFWVSNLALVVRSRWDDAQTQGFVLEANSGEPLAGAEVQLWRRDNRAGTWDTGPTVRTDKNGLFSIIEHASQSYALLATHEGQQLSTGNDYYGRDRARRSDPFRRTIFFTDRSLYRPGQAVSYKGICVRADQNAGDYSVLANEQVTVVLADPNNKEVARQQHKTNEYGAFSGSFTAPRDRVTGRMTLRVEGEAQGQTRFNVEEYKRPKFQVTLDPPTTAPKLGEKVSMRGQAMAYTGAAIDSAKVRWRAVRQVQYPVWWYWRCWWRPQNTSSQEIARGTAVTEADGAFQVEFVAKPDLSASAKDEPTFAFSVSADVTDTAGETRSAQRATNVGYTALRASMSAAEWLTSEKSVEITVATTTLDGEGQGADCALKIHRLKQPAKAQRASLTGYQPYPVRRGRRVADEAPKPDPANPNSWELGEVVAQDGFNTDAAGKATRTYQLPPGPYRALLTTQDRFGKEVTALLPLTVLDPKGKTLPLKVPNLVAAPKWSLEPGEDFVALWGTGYDEGRAFIEIEHRGKLVQAFWTEPGATQQTVRQTVTEAMRGGFTVRTTMVRENRAYLTARQVGVPWSNKQLSVAWEHFVSKLEPGQKETWTAVVTGPDAKKAVTEMVAALYDKSLDAYLPHYWTGGFGVFRYDSSSLTSQFENVVKQLRHLHGNWFTDYRDAHMVYRSFPEEIMANLWGYQYFGGYPDGKAHGLLPGMAGPPGKDGAAGPRGDKGEVHDMEARVGGERSSMRAMEAPAATAATVAPVTPAQTPDLSQVSARKNLNETAFFFPHLVSDAEGKVKLEFTMPEALTQWKFLGFAHDRDLRAGLLTGDVVTAKDLMVQPNPPRFLREGDVLEFTVKVTNQSATAQKGTVRLTLADARTAKPVDAALGNAKTDQPFDIPSKESRSFAWKLTVPDGQGPLLYKAVGSTGRVSDGEEAMLPVLSRRILVTESLPLPIRGPQTKDFQFAKLLDSGKSKTLQHQSLTVQTVSNPSWYALMALPYLMEYPYECSEQVFNRLYANALARHIAQSDPKIRRVFDTWKTAGGDTLDSPLEKNQDLKAVLLEETPWLRQAQKESEARKNVGILFDNNRLNDETDRTLRKLAEMQLPDGAWPWFPGGRGNNYITLYITTGFGRMRHLGVKVDIAPAVRSLNRLDAWIDRIYRGISLKHRDENHLTPTIALYLYGRSFFLEDQKIAPRHKEAVDYFLGQARKYWLQLANRQSQAHLAIALKRFGDKDTPPLIMRSIRERSVSNEELGMFWRDQELSWWWFRAPIETQAMMIEAFDEVMNDQKAAEDCKVWLLKQKQTQDWKTTKATADAIYALLLRGDNLLASDKLVEVSLGGQTIKPAQVEAGTGFYEQRFTRGEITPKQGRITVKKVDKGVAWGSVHWQYLEDIAKITPHEGTPLKLTKQLYTRQLTKKGPVLEPVKGPLAVGDELVVRVVLRTDRDMEYVHLKDHRGSGTEPVNVLSQYKYQDGLAYYESTKDTASHFFIDYLPKGTYVFEYATRVAHRGRYQTGIAAVQCMYAPEFNSHSESLSLEVK